jgi:LPS export ABC transporter protein LptC
VRNIVVTVLLAISAAATWLATWQRQDPNPTGEAQADTRPLGYYLRGARILGTDEQGRPAYSIRAERLDEVPDEQRLRLESVTVEYQPAEETAWAISAASATAPRDGSLLDLVGNVEVRSAPTDGSQPVTITTDNLRFTPNTSRVETEEPVRFRVGDWQFGAVGLRTDLKGDSLELESQVHGTFSR